MVKEERKITIRSFAKINLVLRVLGRRRDGYHTVHTVLQTIDLKDDLIFSFTPSSSFHVTLEILESSIPADGTNLIYRACKAFDEVHPLRHEVHVRVKKNIPVESGLGGGSSNAACTLIALSRFYSWPINPKDLNHIARKLGSDVPFFLQGGTGLGTVRGDKIHALEDWPQIPILLVVPAKISCSTTVIYKEYDRRNLLTPASKLIKIRDVQRPESQRDYVSLVENDLERVVFALNPELDSIKKRLLDLGAIAAALSGSGSAIFGLFSNTVDLEKAAEAFPNSIYTRFVNADEYRKALGISNQGITEESENTEK